MIGGQHGEDSILAEYFATKPVGFLVDVGAADGIDNSNSYFLLQQGWGGILIEPEPQQFAALQNRYKDRKDIICVNKAIGTTPGKASLFCGGQVSTLDPAWKARCEEVHGIHYSPAPVEVVRLASVLEEHQAPTKIDFLSIDCEGFDLQAIESMDWDRYQVRLLCSEWELSQEFQKARRFSPYPTRSFNHFYHRG